ncbi:hypothetical protein C8R47DRAFT_1218974 [Mycena vitilis]|nr:hypothetical protein C8R47DRAFT_1218974 [Mycena vitilis]
MATFRTTSITAEKGSPKRIAFPSFVSISSCGTGTSADSPIVVSTTVSTTTTTYPMTVPPPFATSLGPDERLSRPQRGAPPVTFTKTPIDQRRKHGAVHKLQRAIGLKRTVQSNAALCEGW